MARDDEREDIGLDAEDARFAAQLENDLIEASEDAQFAAQFENDLIESSDAQFAAQLENDLIEASEDAQFAAELENDIDRARKEAWIILLEVEQIHTALWEELESLQKERQLISQIREKEERLRILLEDLDTWGRVEILDKGDYAGLKGLWNWFRIQNGDRRVELLTQLDHHIASELSYIEHNSAIDGARLGFTGLVFSCFHKVTGKLIVSSSKEYILDLMRKRSP